ncbi:hypothetical protein [Dyella psychrodurans]|uniref:DUF4142 domain-containing protein n=1 Tax=Dyella psychrodurans TaxID=1927960 RepID=A0A370XDF3_9GAMM|nr:hypothetical protein [Dyella psychrodurans]RDS86297.1 hypothetical protein DWU99_03280 [Dyella psychrodurans]
MKGTKLALTACIVSALFAASAANAQFHLPSLGTASTTNSSSDALAAQDQLVKSFIASQSEVLNAQSLLAQAYGLKDQAAACDAQQKALQSTGTDTNALQKTVDVSNSANEAIAEQQAKQTTLTAEEKEYYAQSLPHFAKGVLGTRDVVMQAEKFTATAKGSMTGMSGLTTGLTKLKAGAFVAKSTPSYSKNLFDVFRKTMTISQNNGVKVPSDATQALAGL